MADRTRTINRLRACLLEIFPALERALDLTNKGPVRLLTGYQTPGAIRRAGTGEIVEYLRWQKVRCTARLAAAAVEAADAQSIALPGEALTAIMVACLAEAVIALEAEIAEIDAQIEARVREDWYAELIVSMPWVGSRMAAVFLAATGGGMAAFGSADRLAGYAGLAPAPRDSGRVSGNLRRPRRFQHGLLNAMNLSALSSLKCSPASKAFYRRKREEGKGHKQALLALARRRINVLWAMLRDGAFYEPMPPVPSSHQPRLAQ